MAATKRRSFAYRPGTLPQIAIADEAASLAALPPIMGTDFNQEDPNAAVW